MAFGMSIVSSFSRRKQNFRMTLFCIRLMKEAILSSQLTQMIISSSPPASSYCMSLTLPPTASQPGSPIKVAIGDDARWLWRTGGMVDNRRHDKGKYGGRQFHRVLASGIHNCCVSCMDVSGTLGFFVLSIVLRY
uniref:Uncharacterized protein n=1 Tax=Oryza glumipatula TaxID=40148 RepID=A0A0E0A9I1_9ORYZ